MGGGASTAASTTTDKRDNIRERNKLVRDVEKFILCVYSSSSRVDSMWLLLWNNGGNTAFGHFVESERADEYYTLFNETNKVRKIPKPTLFVLRKYVDSIIRDYIQPIGASHIKVSATLKKEVEDLMTDKLEAFNDPIGRIYDVIRNVQIEMVNLMARDQFIRFLFSKFCKNWRANERGKALATNSETAEDQIDYYYAAHPTASIKIRPIEAQKNRKVNRERPRKYEPVPFPVVVPEDALSTAYGNVDGAELNRLLDLRSWLSSLIGAVEILPVAFSLCRCASGSSHKGFPIVYVNKHFESTLLFKRSSILGWNFKDFIQSEATEKDKIAKIVEGLRTKTQASVVITNVKGNGLSFNQALVIKPILDERWNCQYVLGLHVEISDAEAKDPEQSRLKAVEVLMETLPSTIIMERNEKIVPGFWETSLGALSEMLPSFGDSSKQDQQQPGFNNGTMVTAPVARRGGAHGGGGGKVNNIRQASAAMEQSRRLRAEQSSGGYKASVRRK